MGRRSKTWRVLKWGGTVGCALLLAAFVATRWLWIGCSFPVGTRWLIADVGGPGALRIAASEMDPEWGPVWSKPHPDGASYWTIDFWPTSDFYRRWRWDLYIPLWFPFLVLLLPTLRLWWRDRRIPPGHCQKCGYNLTGNVSGICPECGTPIAQPSEGRP